MAEFARLREDVEKKGIVAKAASQRHVSRKEMCGYITTYADREARWIDFTEAGVQTCGIPAGVLNQLKQVHANTEQTRLKICADSVAPDPRPSNRDFFPLGDWLFPGDLHRR